MFSVSLKSLLLSAAFLLVFAPCAPAQTPSDPDAPQIAHVTHDLGMAITKNAPGTCHSSVHVILAICVSRSMNFAYLWDVLGRLLNSYYGADDRITLICFGNGVTAPVDAPSNLSGEKLLSWVRTTAESNYKALQPPAGGTRLASAEKAAMEVALKKHGKTIGAQHCPAQVVVLTSSLEHTGHGDLERSEASVRNSRPMKELSQKFDIPHPETLYYFPKENHRGALAYIVATPKSTEGIVPGAAHRRIVGEQESQPLPPPPPASPNPLPAILGIGGCSLLFGAVLLYFFAWKRWGQQEVHIGIRALEGDHILVGIPAQKLPALLPGGETIHIAGRTRTLPGWKSAQVLIKARTGGELPASRYEWRLNLPRLNAPEVVAVIDDLDKIDRARIKLPQEGGFLLQHGTPISEQHLPDHTPVEITCGVASDNTTVLEINVELQTVERMRLRKQSHLFRNSAIGCAVAGVILLSSALFLHPADPMPTDVLPHANPIDACAGVSS